jgi:hypothetical protein
MGPNGQVNPVPPAPPPPTPPPVPPLGERILNFLLRLPIRGPFPFFDERQWREFNERQGA